jgi:hypothetical protein
MVTDVTILKRSQADNAFEDSASGWPTTGETVKGWLRTVPEGTTDVLSGIMADVSMYRLFLPVGTDINNGDRVLIDGRNFAVIDTNKESTYQVVLKCSLRRVE